MGVISRRICKIVDFQVKPPCEKRAYFRNGNIMKYRINVIRTSVLMVTLSMVSGCEFFGFLYEDDSVSGQQTGASIEPLPKY